MEVYGAHKGGPNSPCVQSRMARTAREHKALMAKNMMSNHTCSDRPLPTFKTSIVVTARIFTHSKPMYEGGEAFGRHHKRGGATFGRATSFMVSFVLAFNRVNIVAVTTILALHVSNGRSEHV